MPITVVLAVGLDTSFLESQTSAWRSAGFSITFARSIREAIIHFKDGDFDLVLLGRSIPSDSKERLTFLIRASGSRVPVVCIAESSRGINNFEDATINDEPVKILDGIKEIVANRAKNGTSNLIATSISR
jgi:DNA-binding NtrC family response regulator